MGDSQPNFIHVSQAFQTASEEFAKCPNVPALQQGANILQALNELTQNMNKRFTDMDGRLDSVDGRLNEFNDSMRAR